MHRSTGNQQRLAGMYGVVLIETVHAQQLSRRQSMTSRDG
jgi:hypothetical protein